MQTVFVGLFLNAGLSEAAVVAFPRVDDTKRNVLFPCSLPNLPTIHSLVWPGMA